MTRSKASADLKGRRFTAAHLDYLVDMACQKRSVPRNWSYIHIRGAIERPKSELTDVVKFMDAYFRDDEAYIMEDVGKREVLMLVKVEEEGARRFIEGSLEGRFASMGVRASTSNLEKGEDQLQKIFETFQGADNYSARYGIARFARKGNVFLVLDDDPMILKQMDHMLKTLGHVELASTAEQFLESYKRFSPNCVFIDIHLKTEKGTDLSGVLHELMDPYAYCIIISADTVRDNIVESKIKGAKGFLGKPLNKDLVFRAAQNAATYYAKK